MTSVLVVTDRDLDIAARTLWGECRGEPLEGQQAVAWVIRTRASWEPVAWWGRTVVEVCLKPNQFSCWNLGSASRKKLIDLDTDDQEYLALRAVVRSVMDGDVPDPTGGATHYQRVGTDADWAASKSPVKIIGEQAFYVLGPEG